MFEKPFDLLSRAVDRIEVQLTTADGEQRRILGEELVALRSACDQFVERWLSFEERVTDLSERFGLDLDGNLPSPELHAMQEKWAALQSQPMFSKSLPEKTVANGETDDELYSQVKKSGATFVYQIGDGLTMRPQEERMVRSFRRGIGFFDLLMYNEAMEEFARVIEADENFTVARLYLAFGHVAKGDYEQARAHLDLLQPDEEDAFLQATVHSTYGHIYAAKEQYEQALAEFEEAARLMPDFHDIHYNIACCYYNIGQMRDALMHFQRALIFQVDDWEVHRLVGLIWQQLGTKERAYRHLAHAYEINGASEQVLLEFAQLSEQVGEIDQARALYKKTLRYHPKSAAAFGGLGWLKMREGDVAEAISLFKKQLSCNPSDRQGVFNLGWAAYRERNYAKAESCFTQLLRHNSRDPYALSGLARTWSVSGKREEAKEHLLQLVAMEGAEEKKLGLYHLGRLALEEESYAQALRYLNSALVYDRDCVESLFYKGIAHFALGEKERAKQCFDRCKRLNGIGTQVASTNT